MAKRKKMRLLRAMAVNRMRPSTPFVRVLPTDYCNLKCAYCWQHNADKHAMSEALFGRCLDNALDLDVGLVSFLGGEPTLWPHLAGAIAECTKHQVCTDLTTNGSTLDHDHLEGLWRAGLDLLNISVDGLDESPNSRKCALSRPGMLESIAEISARGTMRIRMNSVICRNNWNEIRGLLDISLRHDIPISLGFAMARSPAECDSDIHFGAADTAEIDRIVNQLAEARRRGVKIIDPQSYFTGYRRFLARERFWLCNYATRRGWINIDPYGYIRDCTKKFNRLDFKFADLTREQVPQVRALLAAGVETCNRDCYSNCAFDGAYFARHKFRFLMSGIA